MKSALRKIGNSTGLVVPKPLLDELGLAAGREVEVSVVDQRIMLDFASKPHPRAGWAEAMDDLLDEPLDGEWLDLPMDEDSVWSKHEEW